jgi:hypothetical protein
MTTIDLRVALANATGSRAARHEAIAAMLAEGILLAGNVPNDKRLRGCSHEVRTFVRGLDVIQ